MSRVEEGFYAFEHEGEGALGGGFEVDEEGKGCSGGGVEDAGFVVWEGGRGAVCGGGEVRRGVLVVEDREEGVDVEGFECAGRGEGFAGVADE